MSRPNDGTALARALGAWSDGDFEAVMATFAEDVLYTVNVDGQAVPFAMSALGKLDVRLRLQLLLDTFEVLTYDVERLIETADDSRATAHCVYRHKRTGEILDVRVSFCAWERDGLLTRIEETNDAAYLEAFQRFVSHLMAAHSVSPP